MSGTTLNTPGNGRATDVNADLNDAVEYVKQDPIGFFGALRKIGGFFIALFKPGMPKKVN